jgi:hypothetical protein
MDIIAFVDVFAFLVATVFFMSLVTPSGTNRGGRRGS